MRATRSPELLRIPEAAERLNVSRASVYRWIDEGRLPAVQLGGRGAPIRVPAAELESWICSMSTSGGGSFVDSPGVGELYPWVDLQPDGKLRSMYTQEEYDARALIEEAAEIEARRAAFRASRRAEGASADSVEAQLEKMEPYNCEHVVPQSWFAHDEPMRGDLHHLFTCESKCNGFRGNTPYADHPDQFEKVRERCGNTEAAGFEPWAGKGPAARATLYFLIRYPELLRTHYSESAVAMLVEWHQAEPVGEYERHRNVAIFERQGNRNPVIDHPEWAHKIAFDMHDG